MSTFNFICTKCGRKFTTYLGKRTKKIKLCKKCGGKVVKAE